MNCNCTNGCHACGGEQVIRQVFNCPGTQRVIRHEHIVKHQHDTINEYDVIHEHEYTTRDVVREREVVSHSDCSSHMTNYCGGNDDGCCQSRPPVWRGARRW
ncbi:MAG: hypothetical protein FWC70_03075 [Defluviitaleaceae bacterium]|nr:hypothetical protein [Defluviitaleaceae bacterium]